MLSMNGAACGRCPCLRLRTRRVPLKLHKLRVFGSGSIAFRVVRSVNKREDSMMDTVRVELYGYLASVDAEKKVRDQSYLCKAAAPFMVTLPPLGALRCVRPCAACASGGRH